MLHAGFFVIWNLSHRADYDARIIADRHYNRQKPGTKHFVPPGRCLVLKHPTSFWVTSWPFAEYVRHAWGGAWVCSAFRKEGEGHASEMIRDAISCTRFKYPETPELGMITFLDRKKVQPIKVRGVKTWGRTWELAGFKAVGETKGGLLALQLLPENMPAPAPWLDYWEGNVG